jgi:uncharacterized membrane protein
MVVYFPFIFVPALLVIGILGFLFTRSAWRRNSWRFCGLHFFVTVLGLAWVPALLANWTDGGERRPMTTPQLPTVHSSQPLRAVARLV